MESLPPQPATPRKWYQIWIDVLTHPKADTFRAILQEPDVKISRAFTWVAVTSFIGYLVYLLVYGLLLPDLNIFGNIRVTWYWLCLTIAAPVMTIVGMAIMGALYHWIASLFGGRGAWDNLVYCFSAISAPISLITMLVSALFIVLTAGQPQLMICASLVMLPLSIYAIVLYVSAIAAVEELPTGKAVLVYFIPVIIILLLSCCAGVFLSLFLTQTI
jgi:hypothetical protein